MIEYEEKIIENGFVTMIDSDAQVTIQMKKEEVELIVNFFNECVIKKQDTIKGFNIEDGYLTLELSFYDTDTFSINGRCSESIGEDDSYFHDFEIEDIEQEDWEEIYETICK